MKKSIPTFAIVVSVSTEVCPELLLVADTPNATADFEFR
jgi:hypothetical protein